MYGSVIADWTPWLEWGAVAFNLLYVLLAVRQQRICWIAGGIGVALSFLVYLEARLYSDATLQVFYLLLSFYGWWTWREALPGPNTFLRMDRRLHGRILAAGLAGGLGLGLFWRHFGADFPFADGMTTSFSILTTWLVARRYLENWLYWIVIDLACVVIYALKGLYPFVFLFVLYAAFAVWGYLRWQSPRGTGTEEQSLAS
jgi:nicotinamide mononucleotide transporter